ncbi:hypothetical protein [Amycolatopsis sp. SID8362]|uniref:hypothetical protein n=1 Tax=Amycolatopsis sp. SID8362 TaxID=2690346 RepID=UPI0028163FA1|nr:hypothetical protein [Amycolatopsis sp. SID8362]
MRKSVLTVAAAALLLTACDPAPAPPPAAPALAPPATDVAGLVGTARTGIGHGPSAAFTTTAVFGPTTQKYTGSLRFDGGETSLSMVLDGGETRVIGKRTFTRTPQEAIPGKPWVGTDAGGADPVAQALGAGVPLAVKLPDLGRALAEIERTGRLVSAGQTKLGDVPVNHYRLELDPAKAPELFPELAPQPGAAKVPAQLWLDAAARPVRYAVDFTAGPAAAKGTTDYRDWGKPVDIQAPPADQVVDEAELLKKLGR